MLSSHSREKPLIALLCPSVRVYQRGSHWTRHNVNWQVRCLFLLGVSGRQACVWKDVAMESF